ncbi:MAG: gyrase subunit A protein [Parcubacteria group bacterium GW2011_GWA2_43_17]|nr:MAG: gyrase subunit A protein [Parcubacteria group bacterium GW2011_GWA2_43_17]HAH04072.1 DNA gyrase subunit A [Candidatus Komeilibacteria bacterium]HBR13646.1 DNA gyrase subunit A [Candidatus Komeilibacteria bacterium]HBV02655.1 DNA gyrase subunit A [Candidatus Komeilibacteria bacterium]HCC73298.1 DNA gyrase subunit A [Candidatus Komeilibacteria bacterium]
MKKNSKSKKPTPVTPKKSSPKNKAVSDKSLFSKDQKSAAAPAPAAVSAVAVPVKPGQAKIFDNNRGQIEVQPIVDEMKSSYLDYAMSVIVARALPDVRDGLKPVHRRILYAMWNVGLKANAKFRKSATVVGEVLGKYHPHGDAAVYDSMVRMAQDFAMRYPLVNGQGNFGSMDGDRAAAMRYTEAKLAKISEELLFDLEKDTVDFVPNYDGSQKEPLVLPAKLPSLLLNGSVGIAVGMATNIPPHNLSELIDGTIHLIDHPGATVDDLMQFIKGPDFPTGATVFDINEIKSAYATGKGAIVIRANAEIVESKGGTFKIIVSEIPYQVNKSVLLEKIAELVKDKKLDGIRDLRDESDKDGVRIVVELKKDAYPKKVLNALFKHTQLQDTFHVNLLALIDGLQPKVLTLKMVLEEYVKHRQVVVLRRTQFDLDKAKDRAHILEGLAKALEHIDKIIAMIKKSKDKEAAKDNLIKQFKFSERQAVAILEMKLQQLANLERLRVEEELKEKRKLIKELSEIISSSKKVLTIIKAELTEIKEKYGDERKTKVVKSAVGQFTTEDLIPNEQSIIMSTKDGYIKRLPTDTFKVQSRGGKGVIGQTTKEEDMVEFMFSAMTHADIMFFTSRGRLFQLKAYEIPQTTRTAKGQAIVNFLQLAPEEKVSAILSTEDISNYKYLVMVTRQGLIKKVAIDKFQNVRRSGLIAIKLKDGDALQWVKPSTGKDNVVLVSAQGQAIRFKEEGVRAMGRGAAGVRGIKFKQKSDGVVGMDILYQGKAGTDEQLLVVMVNGYGKRTPLKEYKVQGRGGTGIKTATVTDKTGNIESAFIVKAKLANEDLIIISDKGQVIRLPLKSVNVIGRATQGVRLMRFKEAGDNVASVTFI